MPQPRQLFEVEVQETVTVAANGFLELCTILGKFHDLAEQLKKENPNGR